MSEFDLTQHQISSESTERLDALHKVLTDKSEKLFGYPSNLLHDYSDLYRFFSFSINNIGDPFKESLYEINTRTLEREVVTFFADLYNAPKDAYWGYVTNGGTEGNMYGLYLARESLPDGVIYFSDNAHYSVPKTARFMGFPYKKILSQSNGEIDYQALSDEIHNDPRPPIIVATIGTTMLGAVDRVEKILDILHEHAVEKFYIHCDAALGGMILPFIDDAPLFDFRLPIGSISVSGHKMIGSPMPCGIVIARKENVEQVSQLIEFMGAHDTTLSGSRNGHSVLFLWYAIQKFGYKGFHQMVTGCLEVTNYTLNRLKEIGWDAHVEDFSVTIVTRRPSEQLAKKWQLAVQGDIAHLVIVPHISKRHIDAFIEDLKKENTDV